MTYFVFSFSEDGDVRLYPLTKEQLEARLNENYWGDKPNFLYPNTDFERTSGLLIIKGECVQPGKVETVTKWGV